MVAPRWRQSPMSSGNPDDGLNDTARCERHALIMRPRDTAPEAHDVQMSWLRRRSPARRVELAVAMSEETPELARRGIAARHPAYSPEEVTFALRRLLLGDDLFRRAWPRAPLVAP